MKNLKVIMSISLCFIMLFTLISSSYADTDINVLDYNVNNSEFDYVDNNGDTIKVMLNESDDLLEATVYKNQVLIETGKLNRNSNIITLASSDSGNYKVKTSDIIKNLTTIQKDTLKDPDLFKYSSSNRDLGNYYLQEGKVMNVKYKESYRGIDNYTIKSGKWSVASLALSLANVLSLPAQIATGFIGGVLINIAVEATGKYISFKQSVTVSSQSYDYTFIGKDVDEPWYEGTISGIKYIIDCVSNPKYNGNIYYSNAINLDEALGHSELFYRHMSYAVYGVPYYPADN